MPYKNLNKKRECARKSARKRYWELRRQGKSWKEIKNLQEKICPICGKKFLGRKNQKTCSRKCGVKWSILQGTHHSFSKGKHSPNYKGGTITKDGYKIILVKENEKWKRIMEHRWIMEQHLGRKLKPWEEIHHKNGIKTDNRIENLEIVGKKAHQGKVLCPYCGKWFKIK